MRLRAALAFLPVALLLAGCSDGDAADTPSTTSTPTPVTTTVETTTERNVGAGVYAPTEEVESETYGIATRITDVSAINTRYGPGVVVTFDLRNNSDEIFQDYNWPSPSLSTGDRGIPATEIYSVEDDLPQSVNGHIPPGAGRVVKHGYQASIDDMTNATLSVGSIIWQGDFTTVGGSSEAAPAVPVAPTTTATEPGDPQPQSTTSPPVGYTGAPNGDPQPLVGKVVDYCMTGPMYQAGTTMFTDGTTGWTQDCAGG